MKNYFEDKKGVMFASSVAIVLLAVFLFTQIITNLKALDTIGEQPNPTNIITVSGTSDVSAPADTAEFSFTITGDGKTVADAQAKANPISKKALDYLKAQGIADADINNGGYNAYPQYGTQQVACPQAQTMMAPANGTVASPIYCPPSQQVITGYEVSQTISVKVHDTSKAGPLLGGVGALGVSNISGLSFTIDKEDSLKNQARSQAIDKARAQAEELAKELHVHLGKITSFSDQGNYPAPVMYAKAMMAGGADSASAPSIPTGSNKITSTVSISYEIR